MRIFYIILLIVMVIVAVVFAGQNSAPITVAFFGLTAHASLSVVLVITFAAGILLGMFLLLPSIWKRMRALSAQKKKTRVLERQLKEVAGSATNGAGGNKVPEVDSGVGQAAQTSATGEGSADDASTTAHQETKKPSKGLC